MVSDHRSFDHLGLRELLARTGARLDQLAPVHLVLIGASAGMLAGWLRTPRLTADCDVVLIEPEEAWSKVSAAAEQAGKESGFPKEWLSRRAEMFAWSLPLGWRDRCIVVGRFGQLTVSCLGRVDLIAAKVMGAPQRPHDLQDLRDMAPSAAELHEVESHLDRLKAESLNNESFEAQFMVVRALREHT